MLKVGPRAQSLCEVLSVTRGGRVDHGAGRWASGPWSVWLLLPGIAGVNAVATSSEDKPPTSVFQKAERSWRGLGGQEDAPPCLGAICMCGNNQVSAAPT